MRRQLPKAGDSGALSARGEDARSTKFKAVHGTGEKSTDTTGVSTRPGEGAVTEWHTTEARRPEPLKPPDLPTEDLGRSGGASTLDDSSMPHCGDPEDLDSLGLA